MRPFIVLTRRWATRAGARVRHITCSILDVCFDTTRMNAISIPTNTNPTLTAVTLTSRISRRCCRRIHPWLPCGPACLAYFRAERTGLCAAIEVRTILLVLASASEKGRLAIHTRPNPSGIRRGCRGNSDTGVGVLRKLKAGNAADLLWCGLDCSLLGDSLTYRESACIISREPARILHVWEHPLIREKARPVAT